MYSPRKSHLAADIELDDGYHPRSRSDQWQPQRPPPIRLSFKLLAFFPLAAINAGWLIWLLIYTPRVTRPYDYPDWVFEDKFKPNSIALITLLILLSPINALLTVVFFRGIWASRGTRVGSSSGAPFVPIVTLCVILALIWPLCCFTAIPDNAWNEMMKDTCSGFDTRVKTLDKVMGSGKYSWYTRAHKIKLSTPRGVHPVLYIGSHTTQDVQDPLLHYQNFFRIAGSTPQTAHISIDFDFAHRVWRMFQMKEPDYKDVWYADEYERRNPKPLVHKHSSILLTDKLIKNGTWSKSTNRSNHSLIIPEIQLQIPYWYGFTQSWAFEPFLKVHRTANMTVEEIQKQADAKWTKFNDETVMMRTASFGRGQGYTSVCIRGEDWEDQNSLIHQGLGDDMLVPLGLLALYRMRFEHET